MLKTLLLVSHYVGLYHCTIILLLVILYPCIMFYFVILCVVSVQNPLVKIYHQLFLPSYDH